MFSVEDNTLKSDVLGLLFILKGRHFIIVAELGVALSAKKTEVNADLRINVSALCGEIDSCGLALLEGEAAKLNGVLSVTERNADALTDPELFVLDSVYVDGDGRKATCKITLSVNLDASIGEEGNVAAALGALKLIVGLAIHNVITAGASYS